MVFISSRYFWIKRRTVTMFHSPIGISVGYRNIKICLFFFSKISKIIKREKNKRNATKSFVLNYLTLIPLTLHHCHSWKCEYTMDKDKFRFVIATLRNLILTLQLWNKIICKKNWQNHSHSDSWDSKSPW